MSIELKNKRILYVDPNIEYYNLMSNLLFPDANTKSKNNLTLERSVSAHDAVSRIKGRIGEIVGQNATVSAPWTLPAKGVTASKLYDIIFCEYELGSGRTAQDLLEELRKKRLIPLSTVFIMVASERHRDRVMSVLEFAPDAYIIKGTNSRDSIERRIMRAMRQRIELLPIYEAIDDRRFERALELCNSYIESRGQLTRHVQKLRGFVHLELKDYKGAKSAYQSIIEAEGAEAKEEWRNKIPPYAYNGLAKSMHYLGETEQAEEILTKLVETSPEYMEGYDMLAELLTSTGRTDQAQKVLESATEKSPHRFDRQKLLGLTAMGNGDMAVAKKAFKKLTTDGRFSNSGHPENFAHLAEIHLAEGNADEALSEMRKAVTTYKRTEHEAASEFCSATVGHAVFTQKGEAVKARESLAKALDLHSKWGVDVTNMAERTQMRFACQLVESGNDEAGAGILENVIQNTPNKDLIERQATQMLKNSPRALENFKQLKSRVEKALTTTLENAMKEFRSGDKEASLRIISMLVQESPNNPDIVSHAAQIYLMSLRPLGFDAQRYERGRHYYYLLKEKFPGRKDIRMIELLHGRVLEQFPELVPELPPPAQTSGNPVPLPAATGNKAAPSDPRDEALMEWLQILGDPSESGNRSAPVDSAAARKELERLDSLLKDLTF